MLEPRIEEDNVININEKTLSIISVRHSDIILSFKKENYLLATVCVFIANLIDFSKPLGINNFSIQGGNK